LQLSAHPDCVVVAVVLTGILRIGDYVTFKNIKFSSLLCAEGILLEEIIANDKVKVLDDCLFCIHLQRQYSAARELEEFTKAKKDSTVDESHNAKYFQALKVRRHSQFVPAIRSC
jgi:hypothetical protein